MHVAAYTASQRGHAQCSTVVRQKLIVSRSRSGGVVSSVVEPLISWPLCQSAVAWTKLLESLPPPARWTSCPTSVMSSEKQAEPWRANAPRPQKTHEEYHEAFSKPTMKLSKNDAGYVEWPSVSAAAGPSPQPSAPSSDITAGNKPQYDDLKVFQLQSLRLRPKLLLRRCF